jgi:hypothetical protein
VITCLDSRTDPTSFLEAITLTETASRHRLAQPCRGLFCFIGADPATAWSHGVTLDADGFVRTGVHLDPDSPGPTWTATGRAPLPFETTVPAVFAADDVRAGSVKRVASAAGEGASGVRPYTRPSASAYSQPATGPRACEQPRRPARRQCNGHRSTSSSAHCARQCATCAGYRRRRPGTPKRGLASP